MNLRKQPKVLITGGAGYIGSVLSKLAILSGYDVNILDNLEVTNSVLKKIFVNPRVHYFQGDLANINIIKESTKGVNFVIHLAAISDGRAGKENPELTRKVNIEPINDLLQISKDAGVKRFIFASTMGVYGNEYTIPLHEGLALRPIDPYSESKAIGEELVRNANSEEFLTTSLRIAMVYGVSLNMRYDFILNKLTIDALAKCYINIMGGNQKRPQVHINDLCDLIITFLYFDKKIISGESFNVVGSNPRLIEIAKEIQKQLPLTHIEISPQRPKEDSFEMDGSKLTKQTGFLSSRTLENGIREIITKYKGYDYELD